MNRYFVRMCIVQVVYHARGGFVGKSEDGMQRVC